MKKTFNLLQYSAMAAGILCSKDAPAQAVYTDIDPDAVVETSPEILNVDINNDGNRDFAFLNYIWTEFTFDSDPYIHFERIYAGPDNPNNAIAGIYDLRAGGEFSIYYYVYYPFALESNFLIGPTLTFQTAGYQTMAWKNLVYFGWPSYDTLDIHNGNWYPEITDHYLGVRFLDTLGCNHYGWIRCSVEDSGRVLTVKDYAYETKCDIGIKAGDKIGDTTVIDGISEQENSLMNIFCNNSNVIIVLADLNTESHVLITDIKGQQVYNEKLFSLNNNISLDALPTGIYFVKVTAGKSELVKEVFIK